MEPNWKQKHYEKVYDDTIAHLEDQRAHNADFSIRRLEKLLETEYMNEGATSMSEIAQLTHSATIAAYQAYLVQWKKEEGYSASIK